MCREIIEDRDSQCVSPTESKERKSNRKKDEEDNYGESNDRSC